MPLRIGGRRHEHQARYRQIAATRHFKVGARNQIIDVASNASPVSAGGTSTPPAARLFVDRGYFHFACVPIDADDGLDRNQTEAKIKIVKSSRATLI